MAKRKTRTELFASLDVRSESMLHDYEHARREAEARAEKWQENLMGLAKRLSKRGYSLREIAELLDVSHTTVDRLVSKC